MTETVDHNRARFSDRSSARAIGSGAGRLSWVGGGVVVESVLGGADGSGSVALPGEGGSDVAVGVGDVRRMEKYAMIPPPIASAAAIATSGEPPGIFTAVPPTGEIELRAVRGSGR